MTPNQRDALLALVLACEARVIKWYAAHLPTWVVSSDRRRRAHLARQAANRIIARGVPPA